MTTFAVHPIPAISLIAALALAPVSPEASNTLFLVGSVIGLLLIWPRAVAELYRPIVWMPLVGLILVGIAYVVSAGLDGLAGILFFMPMLAILPLVAMLRDVEPAPFSIQLGLLAFCGVAGAGVMAAVDMQTAGTLRAGESVANPIHFADTALLVGFLGLVGAISAQGWNRALFLSTPLIAVAPVLLSGTRGAIVAVAAMLIVLVIGLTMVRVLAPRIVALLVLGLGILGAIGLALGGSQLWGVQRILYDITQTLATGTPTDYSTGLRLQMYAGAVRAFIEAPFFGHGPFAFVTTANSLVGGSFGDTPHLHNDLADMAASGGILGLSAYALFILAPVVEAFRAPASARKPMVIVLTVTLVSGFFVMGLTNAMFGILTLTTTFAAICVIVGFLSAPLPKATGADSEEIRG